MRYRRRPALASTGRAAASRTDWPSGFGKTSRRSSALIAGFRFRCAISRRIGCRPTGRLSWRTSIGIGPPMARTPISISCVMVLPALEPLAAATRGGNVSPRSVPDRPSPSSTSTSRASSPSPPTPEFRGEELSLHAGSYLHAAPRRPRCWRLNGSHAASLHPDSGSRLRQASVLTAPLHDNTSHVIVLK
jgi:hypothetical protein